MNPMRRAFLVASQNQWMREHAPRFGFMRRASARFLPGENVQDAVTAARRSPQVASSPCYRIWAKISPTATKPRK